MKKLPLEQRIYDCLVANTPANTMHSMSLWTLADALYDNCMQKILPGNGARVAHIRRAAEKSERLVCFHTGGRLNVALNKDMI